MYTFTAEMAEEEKAVVYNGVIRDSYQFLKNTDADKVLVRTTQCGNGWDDNEINAHCAGFGVSRVFYEPYMQKHEFSECYLFWRK